MKPKSKQHKLTLSFFLLLFAMLLHLTFPANASASAAGEVMETGSCGTGLSYQVIKTGTFWGNPQYALEITGSGAMNNYAKNEAPWRKFGNANFYSITLGSGITHIGSYAFDYFYNVTKLTLPSSLKSIGDFAFQNCDDLSGELFLPYGIVTIGNNAFAGCKKFTGNLHLPDSITKLGDDVFNGCSGLNGTLRLSGGLKEIPSDAFSMCSGLTGNIQIPHGVTAIRSGAFYDCSGFDGHLILPDTLEVIDGSFGSCSSLTGKLTIPKSVVKIGCGTFSNCTSITEVHFEGPYPEIESKRGYLGAFNNMKVTGYYPASWTFAPSSNFFGGTFLWNQTGAAVPDPNPITPPGNASTPNIPDSHANSGTSLPEGSSGKKFTVHFQKNGSKVSLSPNSKRVTVGKAYGTLPQPKRTGYSFDGWYTKKTGGKQITSGTLVKSAKTKKLYAHWTKTYSIRYHLNGGKNHAKNRTSFTKHTSTFKLYTPKKSGFQFVGWYTSKHYIHAIKKIRKGTQRSYDLYAKWKPGTYQIRFQGNGAKGKMKNLSCTYGKSFRLPPNTLKLSRYKFEGWALSPQGNIAFKNKSKVKNLSKKNGATVTLYARWGYTIKYDKNCADATGSTPSSNMKKGTPGTIAACGFSGTNLIFTGWNTKADGSGVSYTPGQTVTDLKPDKNGTATLYACWTVGQYPPVSHGTPSPAFYQYAGYFNGENRKDDCAVASIAVLRTLKGNGKTAAQNYEDVWVANGRQSYIKSWSALGLTPDANVSLENIYAHLKQGPVICHRFSGQWTHFSVIYAYTGNPVTLEKSGFKVYEVSRSVNLASKADNLAKWDNFNNEGPLQKIVY